MIGELLRLWRSVENIGVRELGAELGVSAATISRIERGEAMDSATMLKVIRWLFEKKDE